MIRVNSSLRRTKSKILAKPRPDVNFRYTNPTPTYMKGFGNVEDTQRTIAPGISRCALFLNGPNLYMRKVPLGVFNDEEKKLLHQVQEFANVKFFLENALISTQNKPLPKIMIKLKDNIISLRFQDNEQLCTWAVALQKNACTHTDKIQIIENFYTIKRKISRNSSPRVCTDNLTGEEFIVRIIRASDEGKRCINILRMCLNHPNISKTYDIFYKDSKYQIVQEYGEGGELFDVLSKGSLSEQAASRISRQILAALAYLHEQHIVYANLKPNNMICQLKDDPLKRIKLCNFGHSSVYDPDHPSDISVSYREELFSAFDRKGAYYMPPELLGKDDFVLSPSFDIWGVGITTYWMLCGQLPFDGDNLEEYLENIKKGPNFDGIIWTIIDQEAKDMLISILQLDPAKRPDAFSLLDNNWFHSHDSLSKSCLTYDFKIFASEEREKKNNKWQKILCKIKILNSGGNGSNNREIASSGISKFDNNDW